MVAASEFPWGHPSRRPSLVVRTVPRTVELQHDEDTLVATTLVVLVIGTHPSLAPFQVRHFVQDSYGVSSKDFTLHQYCPQNFLLIFRNDEDLQRVLDAPPLAACRHGSVFSPLVEALHGRGRKIVLSGAG